MLGDEQQRDEISADHEEDFDAEETTRKPRRVGVVHDHRKYSQSAQAIETRKVRDSADLSGA